MPDPMFRQTSYARGMSEFQPLDGAVPRPHGSLGLHALTPFGRRPSAADFAFDSLRRAILDLVLPPGTTLSRASLAAQLGVSQTPVREALIRLQAEGLVEVVPNASTRVARIQVENAREAHFLRLALEVEVVRRLATEAADPALAERLHHLLAEQEALLRQGDHAGFAAADEAFHAALYAAAGIAGLWDLVRSRGGHLDRLRRLHLPAPGKAETILQEHRHLAQALAEGDAAGAERILRTHFSGTFARIEAIRAEFPAYF
jgi:GntR family transcriptional regulator, rspAB operon transcriptional repressor